MAQDNTGAFAGLGGLAGGAGLGFAISGGNPLGALVGAGIGSMGGGLLGSIFGKSGVERPDISGELAKISALFAQARQAAIENVNQQARAGRSTAVSNLAARGTYRSPVAQNVFNALEQARLQSVGQVTGSLAGQEAQTQASLLSQLLGYDVQAQQGQAQRQAGIASGLTSLGSSLLMAYLMRGAQAPGATQASQFGARGPIKYSVPGVGNQAFNPFI